MNLEQWRLKQQSPWGRVMSCAEAARALGVQEDVFYRWRTGERFPSARKWVGIFDGMGYMARRHKVRVVEAQRGLWRRHLPDAVRPSDAAAARRLRRDKNPPGWDKLMVMIGGGK